MRTFHARISSFLASFLGSLLIMAFVSVVPQTAVAVSGLPEGFDIEYLTGGLTRPTAMAFAPDGRIFIAEKAGSVRIASSDFSVSATPFITLNNVNDFGDRGLIGIAVDPDFDNNHYVYLAYTYENNPGDPEGEKTARVVRYTESSGQAIAGSELVILGSVGGNASAPSCRDYPEGSDCVASDSSSHSIGGLRFGPDDKLYVSTGDGARFDISDPHAFRAQDRDHLSGKVLRLNTDGTAASGNPFYTGPNNNASKVWAYGFRNPYRFSFDDVSGKLIVADVGWGEKEEIDLITPGGNYGWPCREASIVTSGYAGFAQCPLSGPVEEPIHEYDHVFFPEYNANIGVVTGGSFATSSTYPESFRDSYIFADAALGFVKNITFSGDSVTAVDDFAQEVPFPVEFVTGEDGLIYLLTHYSGEIRRITYNSELPNARFTVSQTTGVAPLSVGFDASSSTISSGANLSYIWSFGDGSSTNGINPTHVYTSPGTYSAELTVRTPDGLQNQATQTITVFALSENDAEPFHVATTLSDAPHYFGSPVTVVSRIGNSSGNDPVVPVYEVYDPNGNHLTQYDQTFGEAEIIVGQERTITSDFLLPIGSYEVVLVLRSPDETTIFERTEDVAIFSVITRVPDGTNTCPAESDTDGDGWGWDGEKGCRVGGGDVPEDDPDFGVSDDCPAESDTDGDGWGWDGEKGCLVGAAPTGPICGNGTLELGEQCDDGNLSSGDSCSATCTIETQGPICGNNILESGEQCDDGNLLSGDSCSSQCTIEEVVSGPVCGNGTVETGEQCDDGNLVNGDSCSSVCQGEVSGGGVVMPLSVTVSPDSIAVGETATISLEMINAGELDTVLVDIEIYDGDGNKVGQKYFNNQTFTTGETKAYTYDWVMTSDDVFEVVVATFEPGWTQIIGWYAASGIIVTGAGNGGEDGPICGNGTLELGEQCDDGNLSSGDSCSATCTIETQGPICGNNILESGEQCDDGNLLSGDSCSSQCTIEEVVSGPVCGNGTVETGEQCDDGNTTDGDSCSALCVIEQEEEPETGEEIAVYDGALSSQWSNWSWNVSNQSTITATGSNGNSTSVLETTYAVPFGGIYMHANSLVELESGDTISLTIKGDSSNSTNQISVSLYGAGNTKIDEFEISNFGAVSDEWSEVLIPIDTFQSGGFDLSGIVIKDSSGQAGETYQIESLKILTNL